MSIYCVDKLRALDEIIDVQTRLLNDNLVPNASLVSESGVIFSDCLNCCLDYENVFLLGRVYQRVLVLARRLVLNGYVADFKPIFQYKDRIVDLLSKQGASLVSLINEVKI